MSKPKAIPVPQPTDKENNHHEEFHDTLQEPLSGSKEVKNRNHSRERHGEGS